MIIRKNIVLNGVGNLSQKAVLTLENDGEITSGRVRLYNFSSEPKGIISMGIYQNNKVVKAGLIRVSNMLYTFSCNFSNLKDVFSCAIINFVDSEPKPILYGNSDGCSDQDVIFSEVMQALANSKNSTEVQDTLDKYGVDYEESLKEEINKAIEDEISTCSINECDKCECCEYKKFYLSQVNVENLSEDLIETEPEKETFYSEMKVQLDDIFENNPCEEYLENLISNSKWVKVKIDKDGNYYVLGLIYEEKVLKYICYGVPGVYQNNAPRELSGYPVWFPLDQDKPQGFGYWLSYQDAENGESVKATII